MHKKLENQLNIQKIVTSGESSLQGIKRELVEEIRLNVLDEDIILAKEIIEEREDINFLRNIYVIKKDINLNELYFNDGEVINIKYVTIKEFSNMIENGESFEWLKYFIDLYKQIKWPNKYGLLQKL